MCKITGGYRIDIYFWTIWSMPNRKAGGDCGGEISGAN